MLENRETKDWSTRIAKATFEKEKVEDTKYGIIVEMFICDFFVSEEVIPEECKNFEKGVLKSFNLKDVKKSDLIVKEIFRERYTQSDEEEVDLRAIKKRMYALLNILKFDISDASELEIYIYKSALLGAVGSLFTAFEKDPVFNDMLNSHLIRKFRNAIYHLVCVLNREPVKRLKMVFLHFYEHCRRELSNYARFPSLSHLINENEKSDPMFKLILLKCLDTHSVLYEWEEPVEKELYECRKKFYEIIDFFKRHTMTYPQGNFLRDTEIAIRGNAIGLHAARLSAGAMSLLKGRATTLDENKKMVDVSLSASKKKEIQANFGKFIRTGGAFRHNDLLYSAVPQLFHVNMPSSKRNQSREHLEPQNFSSNKKEIKRVNKNRKNQESKNEYTWRSRSASLKAPSSIAPTVKTTFSNKNVNKLNQINNISINKEMKNEVSFTI